MTISYQVCCLDPGGTTGAVLARITPHMQQLQVEKTDLLSLQDIAEVVGLLRANTVHMFAVERRADRGNRKGVEPYERILHEILSQGFNTVSGLGLQLHSITLVTPGNWKPFMKARKDVIPTQYWNARNQHQRDALGLLYYCLLVTYPKMEITHGT